MYRRSCNVLLEPDKPRQGLSSSGQLSSSCLRLRLTLVEVMSIITSWKAAVSSACRWVCSAIFSLNFRGLEAPDPVPEVGPGPQPPVPVADIFTERTGRLDVVERFSSERGGKAKSSHSAATSGDRCCFSNRRPPKCVCIIILFTLSL